MTTFPELLRRNTDAHGASHAIVTDDDSITHAELDARSRALAGHLVDDGVGKGSRFGILMPNGVEWAVLAAAAWRIGAVLVPLSTLLRAPELEAQLRTANVTHLVAAEEFRGRALFEEAAAVAPNVPSLRPMRWWARWRRWCGRRTISSSCSPPGVGVCRRERSIRTAARWGQSRPGSTRGASAPTTGCTSRCRSSGPVGSRPAS